MYCTILDVVITFILYGMCSRAATRRVDRWSRLLKFSIGKRCKSILNKKYKHKGSIIMSTDRKKT